MDIPIVDAEPLLPPYLAGGSRFLTALMNRRGPRILFVAPSNSVHAAHWISQLDGLGWDVHVYPCEKPGAGGIHRDFRNVTFHGCGLWPPAGTPASVRVAGVWPLRRGAYRAAWLGRTLFGGRRSRTSELANVIRHLHPGLVHTLEMQRAGYMTLAARKFLGAEAMPPWIYSSWGSDIAFFGRRPEHAEQVRAVLAACDYHVSDCERDIGLAREFGFRGESLGVFPGPGGFPVEAMLRRVLWKPPSLRRTIAVKGQEHWAGRALTALEALHRCQDALKGYRIVVYYANTPGVPEVARHVARLTGLDIEVWREARPHDDILTLMGDARVALALSVSDGTPNSMLEAIVMGAFPVQSDTGAIGEWIASGRNGLIVPSENAAAVEQAVRRAVKDDALVDSAAEMNRNLAFKRIDLAAVRPRVIAMYGQVLGMGRNRECDAGGAG